MMLPVWGRLTDELVSKPWEGKCNPWFRATAEQQVLVEMGTQGGLWRRQMSELSQTELVEAIPSVGAAQGQCVDGACQMGIF